MGEKIPWQLPRLTTAERNTISPVPGMAIYNSESNQVQAYNGFEWIDMARNAQLVWTRVSTNFGALSGYQYIIDTTATAITMVLPTNPRVGDQIRVVDGANTFITNNVLVDRNSQPINGIEDDLLLDISVSGMFLYLGGTEGWSFLF